MLAAGLGLSGVSSRKVTTLFDLIVGETGTEAELWDWTAEEIESRFAPLLPEKVVKALAQVRRGEFSFQPGYDGEYGRLKLGKKIGWFGLAGVEK